MFKVPEQYREKLGPLASDSSAGNNGSFKIPLKGKQFLSCIASDGLDWDHVSVCFYNGKERDIPLWDHMCKVKDLFWEEEDVVIQLHPKKSNYVNINPYVLHLWKPQNIELPMPLEIMV